MSSTGTAALMVTTRRTLARLLRQRLCTSATWLSLPEKSRSMRYSCPGKWVLLGMFRVPQAPGGCNICVVNAIAIRERFIVAMSAAQLIIAVCSQH